MPVGSRAADKLHASWPLVAKALELTIAETIMDFAADLTMAGYEQESEEDGWEERQEFHSRQAHNIDCNPA